MENTFKPTHVLKENLDGICKKGTEFRLTKGMYVIEDEELVIQSSPNTKFLFKKIKNKKDDEKG